MLFTRSLFASGLLLCITANGMAETVEEVEVLGVRETRPTIADVNLETYNGFENIITRAEFEDRLVDVSDIINQSVSAQIRKSGGMGSYSAASIRGSTGKQINLYLDGMLLTSPQSGYSRISGVPVSIVEQLEIYPDFTPVQLGDANLGGAINIRTRLPEQGFGGRAALSFGSFNTQQQDLDIWGGNTTTDGILALSHSRSDNDYPIDRDVLCDGNQQLVCGDSKHREHAAYSQYSAFGKIRHHFNNQYSLQLLLGSSESDNQVPHFNNRTSHDAELQNTLHQYHALFQSATEQLGWGLRIYGNQQKEHFIDHNGTLITGGGSNIRQQLSNMGISVFTDYRLSSHNLSLSLDYSQADSETDDLKNNTLMSTTRNTLLVGIAEQWQATSRWSFNAVIRAKHIDDQTDAPLQNSGGSRCNGNDQACISQQQWHWSWLAGTAWQQENWVFKVNIGETVRVPTLTERFGETGAFLGNADLKPEESTNADAGFIFNNSHTELQLVVFGKELNNGIFIEYDARGVGHPRNISQAIIYGVEGLLRQKISRHFSLYISGQQMESENQSNAKAFNGQQLYGFYHTSAQAGISWQTAAHSINLNYQYDDDIFFNAANSIEGPPRRLLNSSYTWFFRQLSINVSINNMLDYRYVDFQLMPAQGRSYTSTITYSF